MHFQLKIRLKLLNRLFFLLLKIENRINQLAVCKEFSLSKSTIGNIWKNRSATSCTEKRFRFIKKKLCQAERENVEEILLKWSNAARQIFL